MQTQIPRNTIVKGLPLITYFSGLRNNHNAIRIETSFPVGTQHAKTYIYHPRGKNPQNLPGIFLLHGMSVLGIDDIRIQNLAKNLCLSGYTVATPALDEVAGLKIGNESIAKTMELYRYYHQREDLHSPDRVGFFSASFSGSIGLIALAQPEVSPLVKSIMAIGAYCHFSETTEYAIQNFGSDNYAGLVLYYNFLSAMDRKLHSQVSEALYQYAVDNALYRQGDGAEGPRAHARLPKPAAEFLTRLLNEDQFRTDIMSAIREAVPPSFSKSMSPYYHLGGIKAPVSLLHGASDPVIAPTESEKIYRYLSNRNHPAHIEVSQLITHGDPVPFYSQIAGLPGVSRAFGYYFSWI